MSTSLLEYEQQYEHQQAVQENQSRRQEPLELLDESDSSNTSMIVEIPFSLGDNNLNQSYQADLANTQAAGASETLSSPNIGPQLINEYDSGSSLYSSTPDLTDSESSSPIITRTCSADPSVESQPDLVADVTSSINPANSRPGKRVHPSAAQATMHPHPDHVDIPNSI